MPMPLLILLTAVTFVAAFFIPSVTRATLKDRAEYRFRKRDLQLRTDEEDFLNGVYMDYNPTHERVPHRLNKVCPQHEWKLAREVEDTNQNTFYLKNCIMLRDGDQEQFIQKLSQVLKVSPDYITLERRTDPTDFNLEGGFTFIDSRKATAEKPIGEPRWYEAGNYFTYFVLIEITRSNRVTFYENFKNENLATELNTLLYKHLAAWDDFHELGKSIRHICLYAGDASEMAKEAESFSLEIGKHSTIIDFAAKTDKFRELVTARHGITKVGFPTGR